MQMNILASVSQLQEKQANLKTAYLQEQVLITAFTCRYPSDLITCNTINTLWLLVSLCKKKKKKSVVKLNMHFNMQRNVIYKSICYMFIYTVSKIYNHLIIYFLLNSCFAGFTFIYGDYSASSTI